MNTIQSAWQSYLDQVVPETAGRGELIERRRTFYAGAQAMFTLMCAASADGISEEAGASMLDGAHLELTEFVTQVGSACEADTIKRSNG